MNLIETHRSTIYPWHCDFNNHMNVQFYVAKFDEATWHFLHHLGLSKAFLEKNHASMVAVEQHIKYYKELVSGDLIHIQSTMIAKTNKTLKFVHKMYDTQTKDKVSETELTVMMIDKFTRKVIEINNYC
ncbi:acyl-CoA thioesterase [uncultured Psychroserpens sp.]|uniref:acyl-CoA thioesterase n=1 Tax=uncultured Psychroserpens sp. TaxID=255436 RepID=UPI00260E264E|nr:acyl-CoA thioesterase [uncultured Psychroserpens sp.]